jgi:transcriptional regulator with XRE-family HTH domain
MKSTIGKKIRQLRRERDMSAETLGASVGVTSGAIYSYEKGVATPPLEVIEKIAKALGVQTETLLIDSEKETKSFSENPWKDAMIEALQSEITFLREIVKQLTGKNAPTNFLKALSKKQPRNIGGLRASAA